MSQSLPAFDFHHLNALEKLELIGELWDSLSDSAASLPIPDWQRQELEHRLAQADANPNAAVSWDEFERRLRAKP
jgi:putative addiction module component (TIGR02574 family)